MGKLKWGVIRCGGIADRRTIPGILLAENAECAAVMDLSEERTRQVKDKYGIAQGFTSADDLLAQKYIDAVYIATPVFCHKEQVFKAADKGKHILLEKPMGITAAEAEEMTEYCDKKGVLLGVGFMMRFHDVHCKIKEVLEKGSIGEIVSAYAKFNCWYPTSEKIWRQTKAFSGGGSMMDMGIHCIDLLQHMTGLKVVDVTAMSGNQIFKYPDTEDAATAILRMDNDALFTVEANFNIPDTIGGCKFEIYGTKGRISAVGTIGQTESGRAEIIVEENKTVTSEEIKYISRDMYTKEIEGLFQVVMDRPRPPVTPQQAIFNQRIVEAVYESQEKGMRIRV